MFWILGSTKHRLFHLYTCMSLQ